MLLIWPTIMLPSGAALGKDFVQFYTGGYLAREGKLEKLYDWTSHHDLGKRFAGEFRENARNFPNPPLLAYFYLPFTYFPYSAAYWIWVFINLTLVLLLYFKKAPYVFCWMPLFWCMQYGQNSILSLALLTLTYRLVERKRFYLAGLTLSFLFYKLYLIFGIVLWCLLDIRPKLKLLGGLFVGLLGFLFVHLLFFSQETANYITFLKEHPVYKSGGLGYLSPMEHTLGAFWYSLFYPHNIVASVAVWISRFLSLIVFAVICRQNKSNTPVCYAVSILLTLWLSPHAMIYEWTLLIIPAVLLWDSCRPLRPSLEKCFLVLWIFSAISVYATGLQLQHFSRALSFGMVAFMGVCIFIANKLFRLSHEVCCE